MKNFKPFVKLMLFFTILVGVSFMSTNAGALCCTDPDMRVSDISCSSEYVTYHNYFCADIHYGYERCDIYQVSHTYHHVCANCGYHYDTYSTYNVHCNSCDPQ